MGRRSAQWEKPGFAEKPGRGRGFAAERGFEEGQSAAIEDLYAQQDAGEAEVVLTQEQVQALTQAFDSLVERVETLEVDDDTGTDDGGTTDPGTGDDTGTDDGTTPTA